MSFTPYGETELTIVGDGVSTTFSFDTAQAPFNVMAGFEAGLTIGTPTSIIVTDNNSILGQFSLQITTLQINWSPLTFVSSNYFVVDPNGFIQRVTTAGQTGVVAPLLWNQMPSGTTSDGSVVYTNEGQYNANLVIPNFLTVTPNINGAIITLTFPSALIAGGWPNDIVYIDQNSGISYLVGEYTGFLTFCYNSYN